MRLTLPHWRPRVWAFLSVCALSVAIYGAYIAAFGVNQIFWDEWRWTGLVHGPLGVSSFWFQHTANRILFPSLIAVALIRATHWNDFAFFAVSALFMIGTLVLLVRAFWPEITKSPLAWLPLPLVVLTLAQYENTLWAFQIAWPLMLVGVVGSLVLLRHPSPSTRSVALAMVCGVLASYSSLQGLLVWPAGLVLLLARGNAWRTRGVWCVCGIIVTVVYFAGFDFSAAGSLPAGYVASHLGLVSRGFLVTTGSVIPTHSSGVGWVATFRVAEAIGAVLYALAALTLVHWIRRGRRAGLPALCVGLVGLTLGFELMLIPGRLALGLAQGANSRYVTFTWPLLVGVYAYALMHWPPVSMRRLRTSLPAFLATILMVGQVAIGSWAGMKAGPTTREVRVTAADVVANVDVAPAALRANYTLPPCLSIKAYCTMITHDVSAVRAAGANVFSDPSAVAAYERLGIVPGGSAARSLPQPPVIAAAVHSAPGGDAAWNALSGVYAHRRDLRTSYPATTQGLIRLIGWAAAASASITPAQTTASQGRIPVPPIFFLQTYAAQYAAWNSFLRQHSAVSPKPARRLR